MSQLVESIKILNGRIYKLPLHEERANLSRKILFESDESINFKSVIKIPQEFKSGRIKCRIIYTDKVQDIRFEHYQIRNIASLKVVYDDDVEYNHKYLERSALDNLYKMKESNDEIIIVKNGLIKDAYYYNLVFRKNNQYFTPISPLLSGTMRNKLISKNRIIPLEINISEITNFEAVYLINAMTNLGQIKIPISQIIL